MEHVLPFAKKYNRTDALTFWTHKVFDIPPYGKLSLIFRYARRASTYTEFFQSES